MINLELRNNLNAKARSRDGANSESVGMSPAWSALGEQNRLGKNPLAALRPCAFALKSGALQSLG
jgi:hypothetical protein